MNKYLFVYAHTLAPEGREGPPLKINKINIRINKINIRINKINIRINKINIRINKINIRINKLIALFYINFKYSK
jgi:hypothetical protein